MRPLFNIPGEGAFPFVMGLISGYPVGAKIVSDFVNKGISTKEEAERMLAFTNNSGPLFIIGTVGVTLFKNTSIGILLFITHILASITVGILLNLFNKSKKNYAKKFEENCSTSNKKNSYSVHNKPIHFSTIGDILRNSITNSISTILMIGGFVVIFSVLLSILNKSYILNIIGNILSPIFNLIHIPANFITPFLSGIIELTNGVSLISNITVKSLTNSILLSAFLLGFGGISILLQVFSIVSKSGLSMNKYVVGKFLQGIIAVIYTFFAIKIFPFLSFII